jgi:DMSO/TMAO reductase YedYZ molybdopterin-dependent catalytic subunit
MDRRGFLAQSALGGAATLLGGAIASATSAAAAADAASLIKGKSAELIVHKPLPAEIETPVALLRQHKITPDRLLFVRNNGQLDSAMVLEPAPLDAWTIEVTGQVEYPRVIEGKLLRTLPQVEQEVVLQCSGNGRAFFSRLAKTEGSPWSRGGMGNVLFKGVPLSALFSAIKCNVAPQARFVTAEGKDSPAAPTKADFEHSIPLDDALARSLIALEMNGQPLPAVHGGPVRLITPGYYATMNVKWLTRLRLEARETTNHNQLKRYRTPREPLAPGGHYNYTLDNSDPNWRMRTKSVIFSPLDGETLSAGKLVVLGVAFNDGAAGIDCVLVSADGAKSWRAAELQPPSGPYAWRWFKAQLELPSGKHTIMVRAIDALGRSQPPDGSTTWNPDGYAFNAADTVAITLG